MPTFGEIKWDSLIKSPARFISVSRKSTVAQQSVWIGNSVGWQGAILEVSTFKLHPVRFTNATFSDLLRCRARITFTRYRGAYPPVVFDLKLRWRFNIISSTTDSFGVKKYDAIFVVDPSKIFLRIPFSDDSKATDWVDIPYDFTPSKEYNLKLIDRFGSAPSRFQKPLTPRRLSNLLFENSRRSRGLSPSRPVKKRQSSTPKGNRTVTSNFVNATEASNAAYTVLTPGVYTSYSRAVTSVNTPNYWSLRKRRDKLPINPYSLTVVEVTDGQSYTRHNFPSPAGFWQDRYAGTLGSVWDGSGSLNGAAITGVRDKAIHKLIDRSGLGLNLNLAQDIAQFRQIDKLIGGNANKIARAREALSHFSGKLKRANFDKAMSILWTGRGYPSKYKPQPNHSYSLAQNWLEFQYGWKILMMEIDTGMRMLANYIVDDRIVRTQKARSMSEVHVKGDTYSLNNPFSTTSKVGNYSSTKKTEVSFGIRFELNNQARSYIAQTGFTNPINLGWELLPYSFVVDWFLPIGPYLETLNAFEGWTFLDGWETTFTELNTSCRVNGSMSYSSFGTHSWREIGSYDLKAVVVNRVKLTAFPTVGFPTFKNPISLTHGLNALALLRVAFKR